METALVRTLAHAPGVRAIMLMGSIAKRTPSLDRESGAIVSDADAVILVDGASLPWWVRHQGEQQGIASHAAGVRVTIAPITLGILRRAKPSVWFCELKFGGRVIWGVDARANIPLAAPADVAPMEGLHVALNYLAMLGGLHPGVTKPDAAATSALDRAALGAVDALAAGFGRYEVDAKRRVDAVIASEEIRRAHAPLLARVVAVGERYIGVPRLASPKDDASYRASWLATRDLLCDAAEVVGRALAPAARDPVGAALGRAKRPADAAHAALLLCVRERSARPLSRMRADAPARAKARLWTLMRENDGAEISDELRTLLARWASMSPAYSLFG